jgi:hypothetical protein
MKFDNCPYMDGLGHELIEAYRRNDEQAERIGTQNGLIPSEEVISTHHAITQHRVTCPICTKIDHIFAKALGGRVTSP